MTRARARLVLPAVLSLALACGHGEPFAVPPQGTGQPFQGGAPTRLTYNPLSDRDPTWLPDGSGIVYSGDRADHGGDRCLMLLPKAGGTVLRTICNDDALAADSLKTYDAAAVSAGGRLAFVRTSRPPTRTSATFDELAIGALASAPAAGTVQGLPFTIADTLYTGISSIRWLNELEVVFRADFAGPVCVTSGVPCATAFVTSGLRLMSVVNNGVLQIPPAPIPGTAFASSVAASPDGDTLYYTINADSRVFRRSRSGGATSVYFDFGAAGVARDVQIAGGRLIAVIGGSVATLSAPDGTPVQYDQGGTLFMVDVPSATVTALPVAGRLFRHPALSPDGRHLVAEADGDLWLFDLP